ncbi:hypothetical protein [Parasitella parasitica]|uniref:Uncharacterized protein n=1 Tax=Parasitella parasitica TaxID=35722 RepID=A0A0B7NJT9_9FUNG|nr:hypothetical protein [Parasitella parasitica]
MANITRSRVNSNDPAAARSPSYIQPDTPWSVVTAGKGKHRSKKQQQQLIISFKPTFVQPRAPTTDSKRH